MGVRRDLLSGFTADGLCYEFLLRVCLRGQKDWGKGMKPGHQPVSAKLDRNRRTARPAAVHTAMAVLSLALLTGFRAYRNSSYSLGEILTSSKARSSLVAHVNLSKEVQIYTNAPQYLAYLLDRTGFGADPRYGRTVVASVMYPVPKLGSPFRSDSGVAIFNHLIYGPASTDVDQVIPFQGELFLDFSYVGVLLGFLVFGMIVTRVQRAFERSRSSLEAFTWQYAGIWSGFLVVGSVAVVSQTALYFFWPVIILVGLRRWRDRHSPSALAAPR